MAAEPIESPRIIQSRLTDAERDELLRLRATTRRRSMERMISMGALGLGAILSGFGPIGAVAGMILGAWLGYLVDRRAEASSAAPQF